jgi:hypothetical protein
MSYFLKSGKTFNVTSKEALDLHETLPADNYVVKATPQGQLYLESIDPFEIRGKRYGDLNSNCERIFSTFQKRSASTGVMLAGEKGSGKSLLAKALCIKAKEFGVPSIIINAPWKGDNFNSFLQAIEQPTIILFDEFEKVYDKDDQEQILTLLDGVFPSKKMFILTCNDKWRVDDHMRNRPGRIYYMLDFKGLSPEFVAEYCADNLENKEHTEKVIGIAGLFSEFNFDMLKALIEEMNRYCEAPEASLQMLNVKPEFDQGKVEYLMQLVVQGIPISKEDLLDPTIKGNPLKINVEVNRKIPVVLTQEQKDGGDNPWDWEEHNFETSDLKKIEPGGRYIYTNAAGNTLVLTRAPLKDFHPYNAF